MMTNYRYLVVDQENYYRPLFKAQYLGDVNALKAAGRYKKVSNMMELQSELGKMAGLSGDLPIVLLFHASTFSDSADKFRKEIEELKHYIQDNKINIAFRIAKSENAGFIRVFSDLKWFDLFGNVEIPRVFCRYKNIEGILQARRRNEETSAGKEMREEPDTTDDGTTLIHDLKNLFRKGESELKQRRGEIIEKLEIIRQDLAGIKLKELEKIMAMVDSEDFAQEYRTAIQNRLKALKDGIDIAVIDDELSEANEIYQKLEQIACENNYTIAMLSKREEALQRDIDELLAGPDDKPRLVLLDLNLSDSGIRDRKAFLGVLERLTKSGRQVIILSELAKNIWERDSDEDKAFPDIRGLRQAGIRSFISKDEVVHNKKAVTNVIVQAMEDPDNNDKCLIVDKVAGSIEIMESSTGRLIYRKLCTLHENWMGNKKTPVVYPPDDTKNPVVLDDFFFQMFLEMAMTGEKTVDASTLYSDFDRLDSEQKLSLNKAKKRLNDAIMKQSLGTVAIVSDVLLGQGIGKDNRKFTCNIGDVVLAEKVRGLITAASPSMDVRLSKLEMQQEQILKDIRDISIMLKKRNCSGDQAEA